MRYDTKQDAVKAFVRAFNVVPTNMIFELISCNPDSWEQKTQFGHEPTWGWMWNFDDSIDKYWAREKGGFEIMDDLGLIVYEHEEYGLWFGIDGGGYDFYEAIWTPLYDKRGLNWHG